MLRPCPVECETTLKLPIVCPRETLSKRVAHGYAAHSYASCCTADIIRAMHLRLLVVIVSSN